MSEAWIIDVARSPRGIGKVGKGALAEIHPQRMLAQVFAALERRSGFDPHDIDDVIVGCNVHLGKQACCIGRMAALDAGWPDTAAGVTVDRFCGSGLTAVNLAAMGVMSGMQDLVVAGGVEQMSFTFTMVGGALLDAGNMHLRALHPQSHQGICADLIATMEGINRDDVDGLAVESQRRADAAIKAGHFSKSLVPIYHDDGRLALDQEQYPRPQTTREALAGLKPAFEALYVQPLDEEGTSYKALVERTYPDAQINYIHHAGNSSGVVDGAAGVVIASPSYAKAHGLKPRARIVSVATAGDSPELMLNAPGPAARKALKAAKMTMKDIDLIEINEAFAVVPLKFMRDFDIDPAMVNVNGGAIALGHPIGATGAIILGTLLDEMERRDAEVGLATLCAGGGMAPCTIIERM